MQRRGSLLYRTVVRIGMQSTTVSPDGFTKSDCCQSGMSILGICPANICLSSEWEG